MTSFHIDLSGFHLGGGGGRGGGYLKVGSAAATGHNYKACTCRRRHCRFSCVSPSPWTSGMQLALLRVAISSP
jgi:hypothetical protein